MTAEEVALVQLEALEKYPDVKPQIVSDHGSQYTSREYRKRLERFELELFSVALPTHSPTASLSVPTARARPCATSGHHTIWQLWTSLPPGSTTTTNAACTPVCVILSLPSTFVAISNAAWRNGG
jgi:hypothetical protein